jgi:hypothetical protein
MIVAGHQPNYLPWIGFFDKIKRSDIFIIEDNLQYVKREFQNRNRIKTATEALWLTVPVECDYQVPINEVRVAKKGQPDWAKRHWLCLKYNYSKAPYWEKYCGFFEDAYSRDWNLLLDLNLHLIKGIMGFLNIKTPLVMASSLNAYGKNSELVLTQCKKLNADVYLSGNGARQYLDVQKFEQENIKVVFQDFNHPTYPQLYGAFAPNLSIVDYLFCTGGSLFNE